MSVIHFAVDIATPPVCQTKGRVSCSVNDEDVTCRRCMVLRGWIPPTRRDEHALDEAKTARAGQCSCSVGPCVHQKIRELFK